MQFSSSDLKFEPTTQCALVSRPRSAVGVGAAARTAHAVAGTALVVATVWYGEASRDWFTRDPVLNALALSPGRAIFSAAVPYGVGVTYCWLLAVRIVAVGAVAAVLHVLVEYPFMQFASSLKAPPKKPAAANGAV